MRLIIAYFLYQLTGKLHQRDLIQIVNPKNKF